MPHHNRSKHPRAGIQDVVHAARITVGAVASILIARLCRLPEAYWAAIATLIALQSTFGAAWAVSRQRFIGTAMGAATGALLSMYAGRNLVVFGLGVFVLGLVCAVLRVDRGAYHYAGITLVIVMLIVYNRGPWSVALHRFVEISVGLAVGLVLTALWPEPNPTTSN